MTDAGHLNALEPTQLQIPGVCYLINSFSLILLPPLAGALFPWILLPSLVAELSFALWLLVKGVNMPAWEQATAAPG